MLKKACGFVRIKGVVDYLVSGKEMGYRHKAIYTILSNGTVQVDNHVHKIDLDKDSLCFRIGVRMPVKKSFGTAAYAAYGPYENYDQRRTCGRYGHYIQQAADMYENYVRPQECGNRSGLDWIGLVDNRGLGLMIVAEKAGDGSVMPWSREVMETAKHVPELPESKRWVMRYDACQMILSKRKGYAFAGDVSFGYSIRPITPGQNTADVAMPEIPKELTCPMPVTGKSISPPLPLDWK